VNGQTFLWVQDRSVLGQRKKDMSHVRFRHHVREISLSRVGMWHMLGFFTLRAMFQFQHAMTCVSSVVFQI
jgi:hypothetical protein